MIYSFFEIKLFILACKFDIQLTEFGNSRSSEFSRRRNPTFGHREPAGTRILRHPVIVAGAGGPDSSRSEAG